MNIEIIMPDLLNHIGGDAEVRDELAESWGITDLRFYNKTGSTQSIARSLADAGAPSWTVIVADHQTDGRGRENKAWISQPGSSIMLSVIIRPERPEALPLLPVRTGLILAHALDELLITEGASEEESPFIWLKWPNDLIIDNGKVGGILVEGVTRGEEQYVIIGIGLNIFRMVDIPDDIGPAPLRFLNDYLPGKANRLQVLERILTSLREQLRTVPEDLMPKEIEDYAQRDWLRGRKLVEPLHGRAAGINRKGYLLLENGDDDVNTVMSGTVRLG